MTCEVCVVLVSPFCGCGQSQAFQPDVGNTTEPKAVHPTLFSLLQRAHGKETNTRPVLLILSNVSLMEICHGQVRDLAET